HPRFESGRSDVVLLDHIAFFIIGSPARSVAYTSRQTTAAARRTQHAGSIRNHGTPNNSGIDGRIDCAKHQRFPNRVGPPGNQPAISESDGLESEAELRMGHRPARHEGGLRVPNDPHSSAGHQSSLWTRYLQRFILPPDLRRTRPSVRLRDSERYSQL